MEGTIITDFDIFFDDDACVSLVVRRVNGREEREIDSELAEFSEGVDSDKKTNELVCWSWSDISESLSGDPLSERQSLPRPQRAIGIPYQA